MTVTAAPPSDHRARFEAEAIPYMRQMFPAAVRLTRNRPDAEDLIQETFARAYQKFGQFTPGTNLRAWLYTIMSRTFYSACRSRSRRPAEVLGNEFQPGADSQGEIVAPVPSAESEALGNLGDSPVMQALAELPEQFKTVIYLADIQQYSCSDIAGIMGTPLGTVMSRLHRGRQLLRSRLVSLVVTPPPARLTALPPDDSGPAPAPAEAESLPLAA